MAINMSVRGACESIESALHGASVNAHWVQPRSRYMRDLLLLLSHLCGEVTLGVRDETVQSLHKNTILYS